MVAAASAKPTPKPALITFEPRQIMLEKQAMKNQKKEKDGKDINIAQRKGNLLLLQSIASYLHNKGFSNTLSALQFEAPSEVDGWKAYSIDLEDVFCKYLETSEYPLEENVNKSKDRDSSKDGNAQDVTEPISKKKRKKSKGSEADTGTELNRPEDGNGLAKHVNDSIEKLPDIVVDELHVESKEKKSKDDSKKYKSEVENGVLCGDPHGKSKEKKKKHKLVSDSLGENIKQVETGHESRSDELQKKSKEKKKNKDKPISDSCDESAEQAKSEALQEVIEEALLDESNTKSKDKKKKKKHRSLSMDCGITGDSNETDSKEDNASVPDENAVAVVDEKKSSKKRKRLASEEGELQGGDETASKESKLSKTDGLKEKAKENGFLVGDGDLNAGKKRKAGTSEAGVDVSADGQKEANGHADVNVGKEERERDPTPKTMKKERNGSAQPKTVNAFQRVKVDEVEFVDERLQDNSYWAKDGADIGYGAKAQEVLGQVRGRDFRHEKTKKKRGSYRGGQIDFHSHSVKFNYSDDDE
ncbi:suppressor protein SRP40-like isoform X2 [Magnolia sinica]|uniref:suppressor protein SRP40-like isoform X2 n=1 Tax=Magnolia sinica TaxID=86752 RepID=UPI00265B7038|nr:suppressor protein SRP40-like isoform X2 [Magnolia sinica]